MILFFLDHHIHWSKVSRAYEKLEKQLVKRCTCRLFSSSIIIVTRELGVRAALILGVKCRMGRVSERCHDCCLLASSSYAFPVPFWT